MYDHWNTLAERSGYAAEQFEQTVYRLVTEQVLYHSDMRRKANYTIAEMFEKDIQATLTPLGIRLRVDRHFRYAVALPDHGKQGTISPRATLLALVLLKIFHDAGVHSGFNEEGEVECDLINLQSIYQATTGRELPARGDLENSLSLLRRWGIVRVAELPHGYVPDDPGSEQPFMLLIRPAIMDVLGEAALQRLISLAGEADDEVAEDVEELS
jgi:hypothetical protein